MEIIEQIGAYAGLAAVLGLAVLSALYFSQARDVKRLREWAGRAPERVAEGATADQLAQGVVAQPQPKVVQEAGAAPTVPGPKPAVPVPKPAPPGGKPAVPAVKPAAATAGAAPATATGAAPAGAAPTGPGAKPAVPTPPSPAATPAAARATNAKPGAPAPSPASAKPGTGSEAPTAGAATPAGAATTPTGPGAGLPGAKPVSPPARPTVPLPSRSAGPAPSQTAILPPRQDTRSGYRRMLANPRYLVLAIAGVLIVGGALAFGAVQLTKDDGGGTPAADNRQVDGDGGGGDQRRLPPVSPDSVTVSVLNGTTIPGLAASIGDEVERFGFVLGNVDNSADQGARNESVVMFAPEHEREAAAVGRRLQIAQREPIDPESQAIAGDAGVVVIVGTDKTQ